MAVDRDTRRRAGLWLKSQRDRTGVPVRELAKRLDVSNQQYYRYESGDNALDDDGAVVIAELLRIPIMDVRRNLGMWVPDGPPQPATDVLAAIAADPRLTDETKEHLRAQYGLLRQASDYVRGVVDEFTLRAARYQANTGGDLEVQAEIRRRLADYMRRVGRTELTADEIGRAITGD